MRTTRRPFLVPLAVVLAGGLAACGGPAAEDKAPAAEPSTSAVAEEVVEETPAEDAPAELTAQTLTKAMVAAQTAAGSYDIAVTTTSSPDSPMGASTVQMDGSVHLEDGMATIAMTVSAGGTDSIEMRIVDRVVYMNMGAATQGKFLRVDVDDPSDPVAASIRGFDSQFDFMAVLKAQEAAILSVTPAGEPETLDGVLAQPYEIVSDLSNLSPEETALLESAQSLSGMEMPATLTETYWIGPDRLIRKSVAELSGTRTERVFSNWGNGGPVEVPPADQILSPEDLVS